MSGATSWVKVIGGDAWAATPIAAKAITAPRIASARMDLRLYATGLAKFTLRSERAEIDSASMKAIRATVPAVRVVWCAAMLTLAPRPRGAQYNTGQVTGVVRDAQGGALRGQMVAIV